MRLAIDCIPARRRSISSPIEPVASITNIRSMAAAAESWRSRSIVALAPGAAVADRPPVLVVSPDAEGPGEDGVAALIGGRAQYVVQPEADRPSTSKRYSAASAPYARGWKRTVPSEVVRRVTTLAEPLKTLTSAPGTGRCPAALTVITMRPVGSRRRNGTPPVPIRSR